MALSLVIKDSISVVGTVDAAVKIDRTIGPAVTATSVPVYTYKIQTARASLVKAWLLHEDIKELDGSLEVYLDDPTPEEIAAVAGFDSLMQTALASVASAT